jgi:hypothetical protein
MYTTGDSQFVVGFVVGGRRPTLTVSFWLLPAYVAGVCGLC